MNFNLPYLPERSKKTRENGLTMMMDKGLSLRDTENFVSAAGEYTDLVKFGFGTALITNNLEEKIKIYQQANVRPYFGGTLFELFIVRNMFDEYRKFIDKYKLEMVEVSDGSMELPHDQKLEYIRQLSTQVTVVSEVGSKHAGVIIPTAQWVSMMKSELEAGAWKVIGEARESGNIGIYNQDGSANIELIDDIITNVKSENIIWEAPNKNQQVWFIKLLGANVNVGNIATADVIPLECLRMGFRGDTFFDFLPKELKK